MSSALTSCLDALRRNTVTARLEKLELLMWDWCSGEAKDRRVTAGGFSVAAVKMDGRDRSGLKPLGENIYHKGIVWAFSKQRNM